METVDLYPSAKHLMLSLRDIGYDLPTAIADVIDNSVMSGATEVYVTISYQGANSWVRISDNGVGMSGPELDEALRYGANRVYDVGDLGKFGLGLKLASFSQCRRLTVASKRGHTAAVRCWDLDHVLRVDRWQLLVIPMNDCRKEILAPLDRQQGTVVFWELLDRVLDKLPLDGNQALTALAKLCREVEEHLRMVFHRFLAGNTKRGHRMQIYLNGTLLSPWDPFCTWHPKTQELPSQSIPLESNGVGCEVTVQPYILPHKDHFKAADFRDAAGPNKWNRAQGFYIYRNDRLIQAGGWNRLRTLDEHTKLARIALDFPSIADTAFKINVSKMSVTLPGAIRASLERIADDVATKADKTYRAKTTYLPTTIVSPTTTEKPGRDAPPANPVTSRNGATQETTANAGGPPASTIPPVSKPTGLPDEMAPSLMNPAVTENTPQKSDNSDLAKTVVAVLKGELGHDPVLLQKVLAALATNCPAFGLLSLGGESK